MRYVSIDIETTGVDFEFCDILEFGAIIEDTNNQKSYEDCPKFHRYLKPPRPEGYQGQIYALDMHAKSGVLSRINELDQKEGQYQLIKPRRLCQEFTNFLVCNGYENLGNGRQQNKVDFGKVTVAGKNFFAFDWVFLAPLFGQRICRRSIDPSVWFWDPKDDQRIPSTPQCLERAGLEATDVHTALGDAWDIIRLTRYAINMGLTAPMASSAVKSRCR